MFKPQNFLVEAVSSKDLKKIRVALSTYLSKNPTDEGNEVTNVLKYVQQNFNGDLWEVQDERALEQDSSKLTNNKIRNTKQSVSQSKSNVQERQASNRRDIDSNSGYSGGSHGELSNEAGRTNKDLQGKVSNRNQESFIPSQNIRKAISNGKINLIREAMIMDIAKSPYFYSEIVSFVLKKITAQDLWNDSSRVLIKEKRYWNDQYSTQLKKDLKVNFTEENLKHFAEVLKMLLVQKEFDKQTEWERSNSNQEKRGKELFGSFMEQTLKIQKQVFENQEQFFEICGNMRNDFLSRYEEMENNKQLIKENMQKRKPNHDADSIHENSRKR